MINYISLDYQMAYGFGTGFKEEFVQIKITEHAMNFTFIIEF